MSVDPSPVEIEIISPPGPTVAAAANELSGLLGAQFGRAVPVSIVEWPRSAAGRVLRLMSADQEGHRVGNENPGTGQRRVEVLLGSALNNPRIARLYHLYLCPIDGAFPGANGYYLRTLRDPFGDGVDLVIIGASGDSDLAAAVRRFGEHLTEGGGAAELPYVHDVQISDAFRNRYAAVAFDAGDPSYTSIVDRAVEAYQTRSHRGMTPYLSHVAFMFQLTGDMRFAELYLQLFERQAEQLTQWQEDQWGRWGFDADFQAVPMVAGWHSIADSPAFSAADREWVLGHFLDYLSNSEDEWAQHRAHPVLGQPNSVRQNHFTFAALGLLYGALTLGRRHRIPAADRWLAMADECFAPQLSVAKTAEDCDSYAWLALSHTIRYALVRPNREYFEGDMCTRVLERGVAAMDNLAAQVPHGDAQRYMGNFSELSFWSPAAWALGDPLYERLVARKEEFRPPFDPHTPGIEPIGYLYTPEQSDDSATTEPGSDHRHTGVQVQPLEPAYCRVWSDEPPVNGFDKISMRDGFDKQSPYLLVDGLGNGSHGHGDANAIVRFTSRDRIWLEDADYDKVAANFHNTVLVHREGQATVRPHYAHLDATVDTGDLALAKTTLPGLAGTDWTRTVLWLREIGVAIVDEVTAIEPGAVEVTALWRTVGATTLEEQAWRIDMPPETLRVVTLPPHGHSWRRDVVTERYVRSNWREYPHAQPEVSVLRQSTTAQLETGASILVVHLLVDRDIAVDVEHEAKGWVRARIGADDVGFVPDRLAATGIDEVVRISRGTARATDWPVGTGLAVSPTGPRASPARPRWTVPVAPDSAVALADIDGDGDDELLVGTSAGTVEAYSATRRRWVSEVAAPVTALDADGHAIIVGQQQGTLDVLDVDGSPRWRRTFRPHMGHPATARKVFTGRLGSAGAPAVLVATESCHVHAYSPAGEELWRYEVVHAATDAIAADVNGDGLDEVLAASEYWSWHGISADGAQLFRVRGVEGSGADVVATVHAAGGTAERLCVFGGWDGHLTAYQPDGTKVWDLVLGEQITTAQPIVANAGEDLVVTARSGYVLRVGADGDVHWHRRLPAAITAASWLPSRQLLVAACGTQLCFVAGAGDVVDTVELPGPAIDVFSASHKGSEGVAVHEATGSVHWLPVHPR